LWDGGRTHSVTVRTLLAPAPLRAGRLRLDDDEAHHALRVLRLRDGDRVRLADGAGRCGEAVVAKAERSLLELDCAEPAALPPGPCQALTIAVAPPKGDRWTDLVRALTELGVGRIIPLTCARGERTPASLDRARRVAGEALKQCRRTWLPEIADPAGIATVAAAGGRLMVGDAAGIRPAPGQPGPTTLVIGPEGGLDAAELAALDAAGAVRIRLGGHILRIETAAVAAAAVWAAAWEPSTP
jgi:16S rRNA (uracil1498-N3)-methyltransferase